MKPFNQWERELAEVIQPKDESASIEFGSIPETGVTPEYVAPTLKTEDLPGHSHSMNTMSTRVHSHSDPPDPRGFIHYRDPHEHIHYQGPSREEERLQKWEADLQRRERLLLDQSKLINQIAYLVSQLDDAGVCQQSQES